MLTESICSSPMRPITRRRWRASIAPVGRASVKPCAASAIRRACGTERVSIDVTLALGYDRIVIDVCRAHGYNDRMTTVRTAIPDDAPHIAVIHAATWRTAYAGIVHDGFLRAIDVT